MLHVFNELYGMSSVFSRFRCTGFWQHLNPGYSCRSRCNMRLLSALPLLRLPAPVFRCRLPFGWQEQEYHLPEDLSGNNLRGRRGTKRKRQPEPIGRMPFVRAKGLEPPRRTTLDPKSSAATNYATPALQSELQKYLKNSIFK